MGRKPRIDRSPEEKWQIVQEASKAETSRRTCRRHGIAPNLFYRWKVKRTGSEPALWGEKRCGGETEKPIASGIWNEHWGGSAGVEILKNRVGE